jgi:hypothetical protein
VRELDSLRARMVAEQRTSTGRPLAKQDWAALMALAVTHGEAAFWGGRIAQLAQLRAYLVELREESRQRALDEDRARCVRRRREIS